MTNKSKKPKLTKEQIFEQEWREYNKRAKSTKTLMTFESYKAWITNTVPTTKPKSNTKTYEHKLTKPSWANTTDNIKSIGIKGSHQPARNTMMERVRLGIETGSTADEIINKSKRIGLMYSKGVYGYITDGTDPKDLGKKNPTSK